MTRIDPQKRRSPAGNRATTQDEVLGNSTKSATGRKPNQGNAPQRNRVQRPPRWPELPGERALRLLAALWGRT